MEHNSTIDIVLPTFRLGPDEEEKFYPSKAKAIAEKIVQSELINQKYDEEDCKHWSLVISDKVRDTIKSKRNLATKFTVILMDILKMN